MGFRQFKPDEWVEEIDSGLDYRRKFGLEAAWPTLESLYYNVHKSMANDGPNIIMSTGDALLSSLVIPQPTVLVSPQREEAVHKAPIVETLDNILFDDMKLEDESDTAVLHAYIFGNGIVKVGYDSEYGYSPEFDLMGALKIGLTLTQVDKKGKRRIEHDSGVAPGMPWARAVPPHDIVVPWGTHRLSNCPWIAHRFCRQIDDLKADPKYENTERLSPSITMSDFVQSYNSTIRLWQPSSSTTSYTRQSRRDRSSRAAGSRHPDFVELYEIHDRRTGRIMVICPGHPSFLRNEVNALQIENRLPFVSISFTPKSRSFWTTPDAYYLQAQQMELSDLAVQRTKIRRLSVLKFLYDKNAISDEELQKLLSPDVGAAASVKAGAKLDDAVKDISRHPDQTLILEEEHLRRNVREQVGFSRNQMGEFTGGRRTATEARIVDNAAGLRMSKRGKAIKRFYRELFEVINPIVFEHWTAPRVIQVLGESGAETWQAITGPGLKSRYSYEITFTDESEARERRMEALQLYLTLIQDPSVDPVAARHYIADAYNDPRFTRLFNADIQNAMRAMRLGTGDFLSQNPSRRQGSGMAPALPASNGQAGSQGFPGILAPGGDNLGARGRESGAF